MLFQYVLLRGYFFSSSEHQVFCDNNRTVLGKGDILKFPKLAETMKIIAEEGADAFYTGKIGQDLIEDIKAAGWCNVSISREAVGVYLNRQRKKTCM